MKKRRVVLNTDTHRAAFNDFADAMREVENAEGMRSSEVLGLWMEAAFRALRGPPLKVWAPDRWRQNEDEWDKLEGRWRKPDVTKTALSHMLGSCELALMAEPIDFIGPVFSELSSDGWMGQFFSPPDLCKMMALVNMGSEPKEELLKDKPWVSMVEPACGVGGMILATNMVLREKGIDVSRQCHWLATDIDFRAMAGCFIQLELTDASALVDHGNTLAQNPTWLRTATSAAWVYPKRRRVEPTPASAPQPQPAPINGPAQLTLF